MMNRLVFGSHARPSTETGRAVLGRHSYVPPIVHRYPGDGGVVRVGAFTSIAHDVEFIPGGTHRTDLVSTFPIRQILMGAAGGIDNVPDGDVTIGSDVYIGRGSRIVGPITIGHGAIVAAYSVVAKDVPPYAVVAGAPAVLKRYRFDSDTIAGLLAIAWWDWSDEVVRERADELMSPDIAAFVARYHR